VKTILHISADFPDSLVPNKTKAVEWLIRETKGFRHVVYSLNRVSWRAGVAFQPFGEDRIALAYGAPPYGLGLLSYLSPVAQAIATDLKQRAIVPDVIHAHKFAVDGVVADLLAQQLAIPFICNLWGHTDCKYFTSKPALRGFYRGLAGRAAFLIPPAPWTTDYFRENLGLDPSRLKMLPVITAADDQIEPVVVGQPRLVTVFAWDSWQRKGLSMLSQAVAALAPEMPGITLDVYGRGGPKALLDITRQLEKLDVGDRVTLCHALEHGKIQETVNRYAGFVLPSQPETYGMVYIEAVLAGVPILWSRNQGVAGLFENGQVGYGCDPQSLDDVIGGLRFIVNKEARLKAEIGLQQREGAFHHLRRAGISARYSELLSAALARPFQAAASAA